jgi:DNA-binding MarR family transcriptional regulator
MLLDAIQGELDHAQELLDTAARRVEQLGVIQQHAHNLSNTVGLLRNIAPDLTVRVQELRAALELDQVDGVGEGADTSPALPSAAPAGEPSPPMPAAVGALPPAATSGEIAAGSPTGPEASTLSAGRNGADAPDMPGGVSGSGPSTGGRPNRNAETVAGNRAAVLAALKTAGHATISDLTAATGVDRKTVERIVTGAIDITTVGTRPREGGGRPSKIYAYKTSEPAAASSPPAPAPARVERHAGEVRHVTVRRTAPAPAARTAERGAQQSNRTYVLECVREGAGLVDQAEISAQLDMEPELVATALTQLEANGLIQPHPDGTYTTTGAGS